MDVGFDTLEDDSRIEMFLHDYSEQLFIDPVCGDARKTHCVGERFGFFFNLITSPCILRHVQCFSSSFLVKLSGCFGFLYLFFVSRKCFLNHLKSIIYNAF